MNSLGLVRLCLPLRGLGEVHVLGGFVSHLEDWGKCMSWEALSPTKRTGGSACLGGYQFYAPRSGQCLD